MKRLLILLPFVLLLTGCLDVPVKRTFPDIPQELVTACPDLKTVDETDKLSDVLKVVTANYGQYNECKIKVDEFIEWYKTQKQIFESVK